jgi:glycopeptide antibiotics resistance protein
MNVIYKTAVPNIKPIYYLAAIVLAFVVWGIVWVCRRYGKLAEIRPAAVVLLSIYLFLVFASTVFSRSAKTDYAYELVPFWSYQRIMAGSRSLFWEDVFNVIMLIPVGFLLPACKKNSAKSGIGIRGIMLITFLISLTIEVMQLVLKRGLFEFDDMFHNTLGGVIGYGIYAFFGRRNWMRNKNRGIK